MTEIDMTTPITLPLAAFDGRLTPTELRLLAFMLAHGGELVGLGGAQRWMGRAAFKAARSLAAKGVIVVERKPRSRMEPGIYRVVVPLFAPPA